jgi:hypothetical protein
MPRPRDWHPRCACTPLPLPPSCPPSSGLPLCAILPATLWLRFRVSNNKLGKGLTKDAHGRRGRGLTRSVDSVRALPQQGWLWPGLHSHAPTGLVGGIHRVLYTDSPTLNSGTCMQQGNQARCWSGQRMLGMHATLPALKEQLDGTVGMLRRGHGGLLLQPSLPPAHPASGRPCSSMLPPSGPTSPGNPVAHAAQPGGSPTHVLHDLCLLGQESLVGLHPAPVLLSLRAAMQAGGVRETCSMPRATQAYAGDGLCRGRHSLLASDAAAAQRGMSWLRGGEQRCAPAERAPARRAPPSSPPAPPAARGWTGPPGRSRRP